MHYLITGATGFIGSALVESLLSDGQEVTVLTREPNKAYHQFEGKAAIITLEQLSALKSVDGVVNLAGAPIIDKRWSDARKRVIRESRVDFTRQLIEGLNKVGSKPAVFVSGSAIGFYGAREDGKVLDEASDVVAGFTHDLCRDWESAALSAATLLGARVCLIRTGIVLGQGGALGKMLLPFKFGLGGPIGHGEQWMSWIHLDDEVGAIRFLLENSGLEGAYNLTAPEPVTNKMFAQALGKALHRPTCLMTPSVVMKLLLGESSELLLKGQRVQPKRLLEAGFKFNYPSLQAALQACA